MAKKKNATALFEAISKSKEKQSKTGFGVPNWMGNRSSQAQEASSSSEAQPVSVAQAMASTSASAGEGGQAGLARSGDDITIRRTNVVAAIVLAAALLAGAFFVGRWSVQKGQSAPTGPSPVAKAGSGDKHDDGAVTKILPARIPGKYYLVIQATEGMSDADGAAATDICKWLWNEKDEPCEVAPIRNGGRYVYAAWSLKPFDHYLTTGDDNKVKIVPQAADFARHIEELGKVYKERKDNTRRYSFSQKSRGKFDPWYIKDTGPAKK